LRLALLVGVVEGSEAGMANLVGVGVNREGIAAFEYYHGSRTHLSLGKDAPDSREVESPHQGTVVALPKVGGLHHDYTRRAA
jgi:hypothetical protein